MALIGVLQLGNAIAGEGTPSVFAGNSVNCVLTLFDEFTQIETNADTGSVAAVLLSPLGNSSALTVTTLPTLIGQYQAATGPLLVDGSYAVQFSWTSLSGALSYVAAGSINVTVGT
jgi:hypothetical protein